jgi:hypothetical protein
MVQDQNAQQRYVQNLQRRNEDGSLASQESQTTMSDDRHLFYITG